MLGPGLTEWSSRPWSSFSLWLLQALCLEHHLGGDTALVIEHGVGEGLLDDGAGSSGDAEARVMKGFEGVLVEDALLGSMTANFMILLRWD